MNKYLFVTVVVSLLVSSEGCRRQSMSRSAAPTATQVPAADSTGYVRQTAQAPVDSTKAAPPVGSGAEEARANVAEIDFRYLTAKSKISFKSEKQDIDNASVNIRIQQDSLIWVSVSKLGIEAARVLVTRDSIKILDKINRAYAVSDFASLSNQFSFSLNYSLLQALIIGNLPLPGRPVQKSKDAANDVLLRQQEGPVLVENYVGQTDHKLKKLVITQQPTRNTLRAEYTDFSSINTFLFPFSSVLTLDYRAQADRQPSQTVLRSQYNKVELIDKSPGFPFTIPATYQRRP